MAKAPKAKIRSSPSKMTEKKSTATKTLSTKLVQESENEQDGDDASAGSASEDESLPERPADSRPKTHGQSPALGGSGGSSENERDGSEENEDTSLRVSSRSTGLEKPPTLEPPPAEPYGVPSQFQSAVIKDSMIQRAFKKSKLEGKQIWYFTAPASVPISSIKKTSLSSLKTGEAVCSHNGSDYGFIQGAAEDSCNTKIMVPHGSEGYQTVSKRIDQLFHIQQINKSHNSTSIIVKDEEDAEYAGPPRKIKGLKMRFLPLGCGNSEPGSMGSISSSEETDEEMELYSKQFRKPISVSGTSSSGEEPETSSDEEMTEAPPISHKPAVPEKRGSSKAVRPIESARDASSKRKRSEGLENKLKKSSSIPTASFDNNQLK